MTNKQNKMRCLRWLTVFTIFLCAFSATAASVRVKVLESIDANRASADTDDIVKKIVGIATPECIRSGRADLRPGTPITLIIRGSKQLLATLGALSSPCEGRHKNVTYHSYSLTLTNPPTPANSFDLAVAILTPVSTTYRVISCSGTEGVNMFVFSPNRSTAIWHGYWYLGYDIEATCTEKDHVLIDNSTVESVL